MYDEDTELFHQVELNGGLTDLEKQAVSQFRLNEKAEHASERMARMMVEGSRDAGPTMNAMMEIGYTEFRKRVCDRLREAELRRECSINRCPRCQKVVRTILAKQCLWCGADWH